jgi:hypothetical protein
MNVKSVQSVFMFKSLVFRIYIVTLVLRLIPVILARGLGIGLDDMFQYDMLARAGRFIPARAPAAGDI